MPDDSLLEVTYYCMDSNLTKKENQTLSRLFIQLHDCICTIKIEKAICNKPGQVEKIVHTKVINTKGHLC